MTKKIRVNMLIGVVFFTAALLLVPSLQKRFAVERSNRTVAFCMDVRDFQSLARQNGTSNSSFLRKVTESGVSLFAVPEITGRELAQGNPYFEFVPALALKQDIPELAEFESDQAVLTVDHSHSYYEDVKSYVSLKFPSVRLFDKKNRAVFLFPYSVEELADSAIIPDFDWLIRLKNSNLSVLYRPGNALGADGADIASALDWVQKKYPNIVGLLPSGVVATGYPNLSPIAQIVKERKMFVTQVEFMKQIGNDSFLASVAPNIISLHSLTRDEMLARKMSRDQIKERLFRAVHERSLRILFLRPYDIYFGNRAPIFIEDTQNLKESLAWAGYSVGIPHPLPVIESSFFSALALAFVFVFSALFYFTHIRGKIQEVSVSVVLLCLFITFLTAVMIQKVTIFSRLFGGVAAASIAVSATLFALETRYRLALRATVALLIAIIGGSAIALYYGTYPYMMRLATFSGVKATLLLPPLLILIHDLKKRSAETDFKAVIMRPALWGELIIASAVLLAAVLLTLRSDNVSSVPTWEINFRDMLERLLVVRPRTKEFIIGYPALVLCWASSQISFLRGHELVLRLATSIGFASAVNTFCHFHTPLYLTYMRVVNGWWIGLLVGAFFVAMLSLAIRFTETGSPTKQ